MRPLSFTVVAGLALLASLTAARAELADSAGQRVHARRAKPKHAEAQAEAAKPAESDKAADAPSDPQAGLPPGAVVGPNKVKLGDQAELDLPAGYLFLPKNELNRILTQKGDPPDESAVGGVFALSTEEDKSHWFLVEWNASGYVKDNDADDLKPDEILESYKEGTEEANEYRKKNGAVPFHVVGWDEKPRYDKVKKHVVWAMRVRGDDGEESTNYNTRILGRNGYLSINLICGPKQIEALKPVAANMLNGVAYLEGKRYADYNKSTDKTAEFGVAALVLGGAALAGKAAKLGLLAKFGKVLLAILVAGKKAIALVFIAIFAFFKRLFGRKQETAPESSPTSPTGSTDPSGAAADSPGPGASDSAVDFAAPASDAPPSTSTAADPTSAAPAQDEPGKS